MYIASNQGNAGPVQFTIKADDTFERVLQLEKDLDYVRSMLVELYNKCPKTKTTHRGKKNKSESIECENCGGLLW